MPLERRHGIVAAAFTIQAVVIGGLFAYGVFFTALESELGWSRTVLSAASSTAFVVMGLFAVVSGRLTDRLGPRRVMTVSGLLYGLGYALMALLESPWQLFLFYGLFIGLGLSTHDVVTLSTVARWFPRRRGIMTAVVKVGTACGQMSVPVLATALIALFGWRGACLALGLGSALALVLLAQALRSDPSSAASSTIATAGGAAATPPAPAPPEHSQSLAEALRTRALWTLCATQFLFFPALMTIPVHLAAHGMDSGLSATAAATLLSMIGASSIVGRLLVGLTTDRFGGRRAMAACFALLLAALLWLQVAHAAWMLFAFTAVYGIAHGGFFTVVSPTVAEYFGVRAHGAIFGVVLFCGTLGGALGPTLAGWLFDQTGSYALAFGLLAGGAGLGLALALSLPRPGLQR